MTNENIRIRHVVQRSLDIVLPLTMVYMCYIILHGHLSPGGGFQGGVLVVGVILMLYFAEGYSRTAKAVSFDLLHEGEGIACDITHAVILSSIWASVATNIFIITVAAFQPLLDLVRCFPHFAAPP